MDEIDYKRVVEAVELLGDFGAWRVSFDRSPGLADYCLKLSMQLVGSGDVHVRDALKNCSTGLIEYFQLDKELRGWTIGVLQQWVAGKAGARL